jgi:luciferase family oxidoreductase group 1
VSLPLSVLDLTPVPSGSTGAEALENTLDLARHAERLGYSRVWLAEHHNLPSVASSAPEIMIGQIGRETSTIRIGSGGIMLPNHAPLVVAEQIGTLEALHPGRIDLGLGRAPGTDQVTMRALRRGLMSEEFDDQVAELMAYLAPEQPGQKLKAIPGAGTDVPLWILGSSTWSAHFAAAIGRPYAFAAHFAPGDLMEALAIYRREFKPSAQLDKPHVMVGIPALAADTDERAEFLATSMYQRFLGIIRNQRAALPPPVENMDKVWSPGERYAVAERMALMVVGGPERVTALLKRVVEMTGADELIVASDAYERTDRLRSYEILAEAAK